MEFGLYLKEVEKYVTALFHDHGKSFLIFHNLKHTQNVVSHCHEMGTFYSLNKADQFILYTSAWFHDTGHLFTDMSHHEKESVRIAWMFLLDKNTSEDDIGKIENCILATRLPQNPKTFLEEILCDADLYHLGTKEFKITDEQVKKETELRTHSRIDNWTANSLKFLESHHYFTDYCRNHLQSGKEENIHFLRTLTRVFNK